MCTILQEHRFVSKLTTEVLVPNNPKLAVVTYNSISIWPSLPARPKMQFTTIKSLMPGRDIHPSNLPIQYSREEMLDLRHQQQNLQGIVPSILLQ